MTTYALLVTALLFGGMTLYSFAFAAFLFTALPAETASALIRKAFPHFYAFVLVTAAIAALASFSSDAISAAIMVVIFVTTIFARQILMPMINAATDAKQKQRFNVLHGASVILTLVHIGAAAYVVVRLANI
ncbi:DUF4149 domain-containing protein [Yoonia sp.]|uniref:DUF4149 domain-containing protein n=1 Tax=Yoonia sp. TaxID=2212373 RepID=UPI00238D26DD|nr:DUF4149 domain-containing protein [Yoonia sp.]MDE0851481.1 DUF4149 domain-containing protein [Yoonia sp.]